MNTNRINQYSESDDTNAGGAEMFFLFLFESGTAGGEELAQRDSKNRHRPPAENTNRKRRGFRLTKCENRLQIGKVGLQSTIMIAAFNVLVDFCII